MDPCSFAVSGAWEVVTAGAAGVRSVSVGMLSPSTLPSGWGNTTTVTVGSGSYVFSSPFPQAPL